METDKIIGFRGIRIHKTDDTFSAEGGALKRVIRLYEYSKELVDVYEHYGVNEIFEMIGLSVHRDYRRKGIRLKMMQFALQFITNMNIGPFVVKGTCDSNYS